jgi:hypothetical protein
MGRSAAGPRSDERPAGAAACRRQG